MIWHHFYNIKTGVEGQLWNNLGVLSVSGNYSGGEGGPGGGPGGGTQTPVFIL